MGNRRNSSKKSRRNALPLEKVQNLREIARLGMEKHRHPPVTGSDPMTMHETRASCSTNQVKRMRPTEPSQIPVSIQPPTNNPSTSDDQVLQDFQIMIDANYIEYDAQQAVNVQSAHNQQTNVQHTPILNEHVNEVPEHMVSPPPLPQLSTARRKTPRRIRVDDSTLASLEGYGFHKDELKAGTEATYNMPGERSNTLGDTQNMSFSWSETGARQVVISFLRQYICTGYMCLLEDGGKIFEFEGNEGRCDKKSVLRIHRPLFYWKIATRADLGLADAYIDGDFSCAEGEEGLLNMLSILIANKNLSQSVAKKHKGRGWWTPMLYTAVYWSATAFLRHVSKQNTLTQARRNISRHYDLSNDFFSLFLDETLGYSCPVFKGPEEPLKDAQLRKMHIIIEKAQIDTSHEVLEIGFGWGSLALEIVKQTGCKYTGLTLSEEQLKFAQKKVNQACLQDRITLLLSDYRELPGFHKYDRIIICEMLEHVGHEYLEEIFSRCEYLLAENGLLVLQFISIPDERYDEYRRSSDFIKEYIFPGVCLPSLSRITSAMAAASRLCVEHVENIGIHYYQTLLQWRKTFHSKRREILKLGFNEQFIRTWDYYFAYCAEGFKSLILRDYQMVLSRPGNVAAFKDPYSPIASLQKFL